MMKSAKRLLWVLCVAIPVCGMAQTPMPKHEVRAVWLTTIGGA